MSSKVLGKYIAGKHSVDNKNALLIECGLPDREGGNLRGCRLARLLLGGDNEGRRSSSSPCDPWSQSGAMVGGAKPESNVRETRKLQKRRACGVHGGGVGGVRLAYASIFSRPMIRVTVQVLGAPSRDLLHTELTQHAFLFLFHFCYIRPCAFQEHGSSKTAKRG